VKEGGFFWGFCAGVFKIGREVARGEKVKGPEERKRGGNESLK